MSNDKVDATFHPTRAVVHLSILYDVMCHECGWESKGNPFSNRDAAMNAQDAHRCGDTTW